jgi:replicative DNA helicase
VSGLVPDHYYSKFYREVFICARDFLASYGKPIGEHLFDEINRLRDLHPKDEDIYHRIYVSVYQLKDTTNAEYTLRSAGDFVAYQTTKAALGKSLTELEAGTAESVAKVHSIWGTAMKSSAQTMETGTFLSDKKSFLSFLDQSDQHVLPTGIAELDVRGIGPTKQALHLTLALYGRGKSWWLMQCLKHGILSRRRVLYITLEMPLEQCCARFASSYFGFGKVDKVHEYFTIAKDGEGRVVDLEAMSLKAPGYMSAEGAHKLSELADVFGRRPPAVIKAFPNGKLTMDHLNSYLDMLSALHGFVPDMILLDYLALCKIRSPENKRVELGQLALDYRAIAQERNLAAVTVGQLNRGAGENEYATGDQIGECFDLAAHSDFMQTLNQTQAEKSLGLLRLWIDKAREKADKFALLLSTDFARGQFCTSSALMSSAYNDLVKGLTDA